MFFYKLSQELDLKVYYLSLYKQYIMILSINSNSYPMGNSSSKLANATLNADQIRKIAISTNIESRILHIT